jgi:hypothetical protein
VFLDFEEQLNEGRLPNFDDGVGSTGDHHITRKSYGGDLFEMCLPH